MKPSPMPPEPTERDALIARMQSGERYDVAIIGGGATGLGIALEASLRGLRVALFERADFAKGTSSRSTKLLHGGVRYLAQGNIPLVREALHERATILHNAPHLAQPLAFLMPCYRSWQIPFYWAGLKAYDALAGRQGLGKTQVLTHPQTVRELPNVLQSGLLGSIKYWDAQFDDGRLALALARTAAQKGAHLLNYCRIVAIDHCADQVSGVTVEDVESGQQWPINARCVINATGVWVDELRQQDDASAARPTRTMVAPSQGVHVVVDASFMASREALIIPKTADGRVLFAVPWLGKVILGTTDTPREHAELEPRPLKAELDFILTEAAAHLQRAPGHQDIRSIWVGLRPLVKPPDDDGKTTKKISREHTIITSASGLVTVTGGKWTTYRVMAQQTLQHCIAESRLPPSPDGLSIDCPLVGAQTGATVAHSMTQAPGLASYGDEQAFVQELPGARNTLAPGLTEAMVRFAARYEYARTVEDMLARRSRLLFLDARLAQEVCAAVARILEEETSHDPQLRAFDTLASHYLELPT
jgi:glycerol-3-phosphate dehydrogenase